MSGVEQVSVVLIATGVLVVLWLVLVLRSRHDADIVHVQAELAALHVELELLREFADARRHHDRIGGAS